MRAWTNNGLGTEPTVTEARAGAREAESTRARTLSVGPVTWHERALVGFLYVTWLAAFAVVLEQMWRLG